MQTLHVLISLTSLDVLCPTSVHRVTDVLGPMREMADASLTMQSYKKKDCIELTIIYQVNRKGNPNPDGGLDM